MSSANTDHRYLNHDGVWRGSALDGVELRADGSAVLAALPAPSAAAAPASGRGSAAGLAVDASGNVYYSFPDRHLVHALNACTGETSAVPCLTGPGADPGELRAPRGLLALDRRGALLICDAGNRRVQLVEPRSGQVLEIWSRPFVTPVAAALDPDGSVYVADEGAQTVFKIRPEGLPVASFAEAVRQSELLERPCGVALVRVGTATRIYVLDRAQRAVFVFDAHGDPVRDEGGEPLVIGHALLRAPIALAASEHSLYVSDETDDGSSRVLRFQTTAGHPFVGEVSGLAGAGALTFAAGRLWAQLGASAPLPLAEEGAFRRQGGLESPAIDPGRKVAWTSVHLHAEALAPGAHLQVSFRLGDQPDGSDAAWQDAPRDALHVHLRDQRARYCWIRVQLSGDGLATPVLTNASVRFDQPGYLAHLPAVYRAQTPSRDFLARFLALFESMGLEHGDAIEQLPELFDPAAIPAESLPWLASWLAVELDERWSTDKQRAAIVRAYREHAARGTADGLRRAIRFETGVPAVLVEPALQAAWWALPAAAAGCGVSLPEDDGSAGAGSLLGFTTRLAAAQPDSAVLGTANLDRSRILHEGDFGVPLFDDTAHHFVVHVYRGAADAAGAREAVRRVIERERPAHTSYCLQSIEPRFAVGVQACVGFDTVVAGPPEPSPLGETAGPLRLSGDPPARVGEHSRTGQGLRL
ncbi:phage tail protein I [Sorangium sp. So ce542]|uniref:phage tail protein I n=1 Tax=Sorangium sp. So ce542 TaxID=3133316 RepID=UPI003F5E9776